MMLNEWKLPEKVSFIKRDKVLRGGLAVMSGFMMVILTAAIIVYCRVPPQVPFLYTRPWGEAQLIRKQEFLMLETGVLAAGLIGMLSGLGLYKQDQVLSRLVIWCLAIGLFLALLSVMTVWLRTGY